MGQRTQHPPGSFSWAELSTPDQEGAKRFYAELFGWALEDLPVSESSTYTIARLDGAAVAAISPQPPPQREAGVPPLWNSFVTVASVDDSAGRAAELGAHVHAGPFDVMSAGRMAVLQDPQGAFVMLWEPRETIGSQLVNTPGALSWNELASPDLEGSAAFYSGLFGWSFERLEVGDLDYRVIKRPDGGSNGGMMPPVMEGQPPSWLVYFGCADADRAAERVGELGGGTLAGPMDVGSGNRIVVVRDPQGAVFALYSGRFDD